MSKKGTGNWKPLPADPGPQEIVGEVAPMMPIDPEVIKREKQEVPVSQHVPTEIGGGSNIKGKKK